MWVMYSGLLILLSKTSKAVRPIVLAGRVMFVIGGSMMAEEAKSPNPMMAMSSGIFNPKFLILLMAPIVIISFWTKRAVIF